MWYRLVVPSLVLVLALGPLGCVRSQMSGFGWGRSGKNAYRSFSPATLSDQIRTTIKVSAENSNATDQAVVLLHERSPELAELARLTRANPKDLASRWRLAKAYTTEGLYSPAFQLYQEIKSQAPQDPKVNLAVARISGQAHLMLGNQRQARKSLELALQINPKFALARRLLGRAPAPQAEKESVAQTPSRPSKQISGAVRAEGHVRPKLWSITAKATNPGISLPAHAIQESVAPEPAHTLDLPTGLPQPTLPYSLPPALKKFLQESSPNPLQNGRSVLIDARAEAPRWFHDEIEVATDSGNAFLIPVVLVDLEAALASYSPPSNGPALGLRPQLRAELANLLEESNESEDSLGRSAHFDRSRWLGLNGLIDFPNDILGLERNTTKTAALFPPASVLLGEGEIWKLALMILFLSCAAVPAGRRRRALPRRLQPRRPAAVYRSFCNFPLGGNFSGYRVFG